MSFYLHLRSFFSMLTCKFENFSNCGTSASSPKMCMPREFFFFKEAT